MTGRVNEGDAEVAAVLLQQSDRLGAQTRRVGIVRQENAGKPAALNSGVRNASYDSVVMMDGDTVFEPDTVRQLVRPFADPEVGAVAGSAKVGNRVVVLSLAAIGYGGWYPFTHQAESGTYDLDENTLAQAFWSAGFVLLLMWAKARFRIDFAGLTRFKRLDRLVTVFNARAVTIYLWHELALILAVPLIDSSGRCRPTRRTCRWRASGSCSASAGS
jgi:glycosyltransferase involved in cell wall biosynthesis